MLANGTLVQDKLLPAPSSPRSTPTSCVGVPGPVWYTGAIFQGGLADPAGQIGVARRSVGGRDVAAGNVVGPVVRIEPLEEPRPSRPSSSSSRGADEFQVEASSGYPAYTAAAEKWLDKPSRATS